MGNLSLDEMPVKNTSAFGAANFGFENGPEYGVKLLVNRPEINDIQRYKTIRKLVIDLKGESINMFACSSPEKSKFPYCLDINYHQVIYIAKH